MTPNFISSDKATIRFFNTDNMVFMKDVPDKFYDLACIDPEYGINRSQNFGMKEFGWKQHKRSDWDKKPPDKTFFNEIFRISQNQIIWGGNYFVNYLKPSMGWVFWDKMQTDFSTSDGELAYTSFNCKLKRIYLSRGEALSNNGGTTIHPTQKPIKLYRWLLQNYAKPGNKIFDSHGGSFSSAIAADMEGFDLDIVELDPDYFKTALERFKIYKSQKVLF